MTKLRWHPSLKKTFKGCEVWWQSSIVKRSELEIRLAELAENLAQEGRLRTYQSTLMLISQAYGIEACLLGANNEIEEVVRPLHFGVKFRALAFLKTATRSLPGDESQPLLPFWSSMMAVGPTMLSDWALGRQCAFYLILVAHKDMRINVPEIRKDGWGKGTNDAFLIYLLSQAYGIPTHYEPAKPIVEPYCRLLEMWRSTDEDTFRSAMMEAAEFHISRSKDGTDRNMHEFEKDIDRVYPGELLAVQALRRRDGLPEFQTGHLLIDTPWSIIRDLPDCEIHPLAAALEDRLRKDDPEFW